MSTLHEEMLAILREHGCAMSARDIADAVNRRGNYARGDGAPMRATQIRARAANYAHLFVLDQSSIALADGRARELAPSASTVARARARRSTTDTGRSQQARSTATVHGLPPVADPAARVLVLGTMPGAESLRLQQYYANPRNQFWPILAATFGEAVPARYPERLELARRHGVALWDVLEDCARVGSLDAKITRGSERPNDIIGFLRSHPQVRTIALNGRTAAALFDDFVEARRAEIGRELRVICLPSTSPAHTIPFASKLDAWAPALR